MGDNIVSDTLAKFQNVINIEKLILEGQFGHGPAKGKRPVKPLKRISYAKLKEIFNQPSAKEALRKQWVNMEKRNFMKEGENEIIAQKKAEEKCRKEEALWASLLPEFIKEEEEKRKRRKEEAFNAGLMGVGSKKK